MRDKMEERARQIEYNGVRIWYSDYTNLHGQEFVDLIWENNRRFLNRPPEELEDSLVFLDITGCAISRDVMRAFEESGKLVKPHQKALAVVGVAGLKRVFVDFLSRVTLINARIFTDSQKALDWLVSQAE